MYQASEAILIAPTALWHGFGTGRIARLAGGKAGKSMDERIESFLADVLALEGEDANAIREGVRIALADYEQLFRVQEVNK